METTFMTINPGTGLHEKLYNIQQELKAPKDQKNDFGKYNYRSAEKILEAVKPLLAANRCVLVLRDTIEQKGDRFYIKATAELRDLDSGGILYAEAYAREPEAKKGMDESQITGTASSYARKYALNGLFAIDDTKDADTNEHRRETEARAKAEEEQKKPQKKTKDPEEASDDDRLDLIQACEVKGKNPEKILKEAGWTGEKRMTKKEYLKAKEILEASE